MSKNISPPFRYDFVGSFLRPTELKDARRSFEAGTISAKELKAVEDRCILDLIEKQKKAGYHVLTDGEFRRATWHLDFMWGFAGIDHKPTQTGLPFQGRLQRKMSISSMKAPKPLKQISSLPIPRSSTICTLQAAGIFSWMTAPGDFS